MKKTITLLLTLGLLLGLLPVEAAVQRVAGAAKRLSPRDRAEGRHALHGPGGGQRRPHRQADAVL